MTERDSTLGLFLITAVAEIAGCYLPYLWLRGAAYGGVYVVTSILWLWQVDRRVPDRWDLIGAAITIVGMGVIAFGPHRR